VADSSTSDAVQKLLWSGTLEARLRQAEEKAAEELAAMEEQLQYLEKELEAERRRRLSEQLRAIIEGAYFTMHKASDSSGRHLWYSPSASALKWALERPRPGTAGPLPDNKRERSVSVKHIQEVVSGARLFPSQHARGWVGLKTLVVGLTKSKGEGDIPSHVEDKHCFSLVFSGNSAIHLELPEGGNGRSRDEWVAAFADLAAKAYGPLMKSVV